MARTTLNEIALRLKLSPATVSRALRDHPDISPETKKNVKHLADQLGYRPNILASGLAKRRTHMIGAVVPELSTSFFSNVIKGFNDQARKNGFQIIIIITEENKIYEKEALEYFTALSVDGILISVSQETVDADPLERIKKNGIPIVFYDRVLEKCNFSAVTVDDKQGAVTVVEHLLNSGFKKIFYLGPTKYPSVAKKRYQGYLNALDNNNISYTDNFVIQSKISDADAYLKVKGMLQNSNKPDAIFCINDLVAVGAYRAIVDANFSIPNDIGLAGFGNCIETFMYPVSITTVEQPAFEIGKKAVELLIDQIENKNGDNEIKNVELLTKLIIRKSTTRELKIQFQQ